MSGRCQSCNCILDDFEMTAKWPGTLEYTNMCFTCQDKADPNYEDDVLNLEFISIEEFPESLI